MTDDDRIEILAQALWMKHFGITVLDQRWVAYAKANPDVADSLREQAKAMIETARPHTTHSLGWLP